jgi:CRP-like cAMP-binding protein
MRFGDTTYANFLGEMTTYNDGDVIFEEGTAGGWVYVVAAGEVEIYKSLAGKKVILDRIHEGEVIGEMSFFDQHTRSASARAVGQVGLLKFDDDFLRREYEKLPNSYKVILEAMTLRMRSMMRKTAMLAGNPDILRILAAEAAKRKQG